MMKLKRIEFGEDKFRKLGDLSIEIAPRITVIAGHNGIGKSTILGLIANCSGMSKDDKNLFNTLFQSNFQEAFFLDYHRDFFNYQNSSKPIPKVILEYEDDAGSLITKSCAVSTQKISVKSSSYKSHMVKVPTEKVSINSPGLFNDDSNKTGDIDNDMKEKDDLISVWRLRIIPRTIIERADDACQIRPEASLFPQNPANKSSRVSGSGKVPIPTLYLGMSRMAPIGEFDNELIEKKKAVKFHNEDKVFIENGFNSVLRYKKSSDSHIVFHSFKNSKKKSFIPSFEDHDTLSVSLGQDSLSSIVTALASFNKLKREKGENYKGGILVIDEVDAGFHPHAQEKLISLLSKTAKDLDLQIIITTHSLTVIKKILSDNDRPGEKHNSVVYLMDTNYPYAMENPTYTKIKNDMLMNHQKEDAEEPAKVYFEDREAAFFFRKILQGRSIIDHKANFGRSIQENPLNVGCDILMKLISGDDYFKKVVIVPDNDVFTEKTNRDIINANPNICPLPGSVSFDENTKGTDRTPEKILFDFLSEKLKEISEENRNFWKSVREGNPQYTSNFVEERILSIDKTSENKQRDVLKRWFNENINFISNARIVELWCNENKSQVDNFISKLTAAIDYVSRSEKPKTRK